MQPLKKDLLGGLAKRPQSPALARLSEAAKRHSGLLRQVSNLEKFLAKHDPKPNSPPAG